MEKRKVRLDRERAWDLYWTKCMTSTELAKELHVSLSTIRKWRAEENLPENHKAVRDPTKRRLGQMSRLERDAYNAAKLGYSYGEYMSRFPAGLSLEDAVKEERRRENAERKWKLNALSHV